jgi:hypothetical protein
MVEMCIQFTQDMQEERVFRTGKKLEDHFHKLHTQEVTNHFT